MSLNNRIVITMGDPSGIGSEIIVKALNSSKLNKGVRFIVVGDRFVFEKVKGCRNISNRNVEFIDLNNVNRRNFTFGKVNAGYGRAALEYINVAYDLMREKNITAMVTAPVSKEAIAKERKNFSGQTEYIAGLSRAKQFGMLLINDTLKIALVTRHIRLKQVAPTINKGSIIKIVRLTDKFLKRFYLINKPKIAICSLNPHASDNGLIGNEEKLLIIPAVEVLKRTVRCFGPYPADSVFSINLKDKFDAAIAMYHDQALIPLKITTATSGVNITMGLPFIRTSPLHGVAFDIAGKDKADSLSMISAINTSYTFLKNAS